MIPITFSLKVNPRVMVNRRALIGTGPKPALTERRKNSLTTPDGRIRAMISPKAVPTIAPKKRMRATYPRDLFLIIK
jgi:hypothetical protein